MKSLCGGAEHVSVSIEDQLIELRIECLGEFGKVVPSVVHSYPLAHGG